ncbi:dynein regulatory complex subunit 5 [Calliopsis andreniformis]|uniref:dynein regulatory complex subunit 5 n=1 Tax=Calliopsis andreniformis TaxID=337506 RepID=UPI003FCDD40A
MRIPHTIPRNAFEAYRCSHETAHLIIERERTIRVEDTSWDEVRVPTLRTLAIRVIASVWKINPIIEELPTCEDRADLIEILPTDLPLELTIKKIDDEYYWERCSKNRWSSNNPADHGHSWRQRYCEGHISEYLENLEPTYFETQREDCENIIGLVRNYVHTIRLRSLLPTKKQRSLFEEEDPCVAEEDVVHHIPMNIILPQFPNLVEIQIYFGLIYMNDGFEWRDFQFSVEDCLALGRGVKGCPKLKRFVLTRSNLDQPRAAGLLQGMVENDNIEEVDFSHCKLADEGAHAVGEFLSLHKNLKSLYLTNNDIGPRGVAGIVYGLLKKEESILKHLDLRLNPLLDTGFSHICAYLIRSDSLKVLNVSGCGITADGGLSLVEVLNSGCIKFEALSIDISNNNFGEAVGEALDAALKSIPFVVGFDGRMCNFSGQSECSIHESVYRNKERRKKEETKRMLVELENT